MRIEKAHLYVEKYSRRDQEMLLDFVREDEFLYFRNYGDYVSSMKLSEHYEPTMLLLYGCMPKRRIREGDIITTDMDRLLTLRREEGAPSSNRSAELPASVCFEFQNGAHFANLFDDAGSSVSGHVDKDFITHLESAWESSPCALDDLDSSFELRVWNVGQGNTNSIFDGRNLTLFDFGASMYCSKTQLQSIIHRHTALFKNKPRTSLIISHWDIDHYNLLCAVDDTFLRDLCCVFCPPDVIGLTAAQIAARMNICRYRFAVPPALRISHGKYGIREYFTRNQYTLFTGEAGRDKNKSGLLLAIHTTTSAAFLTADHTNYQVWDQMYSYIKRRTDIQTLHIVVPHHGGSCGKTAVQVGAPSGIAAVSVGSNNYGHPHRAALNTYKIAKYHVLRTDRSGDIIIPMK